MNRIVLAILACLCAGMVDARQPVTFDQAAEARAAGETEAARASFRRLAENGFAAAQHQLGSMLLAGEGGGADAVEGALWIRLAAAQGHQAPGETPQHSLEPAQRDAVAKRFPDWQRRYSETALFARHAPEPCDDCGEGQFDGLRPTFGTEELVINGRQAVLHKRAPKYPRELRRRGIPGFVRLGAWVGPDGRFENPHVIFSDPEWIFDGPALAALLDWRVEWEDSAPRPGGRYVSESIMFYLDGRSWERKARRQYERLIDDWDEDVAAGYRAARMASILGFGDLAGGHQGFMTLMHESSKRGLARAQIDLHDHLQGGRGIRQDSRAAAFWLHRAALSGDALAQFLLSLRGTGEAQFDQALLSQAAEAGSVPAIMTVLRQELAEPATADKQLLERLVELLPEFWYMVNPDQELVERAKSLAAG